MKQVTCILFVTLIVLSNLDAAFSQGFGMGGAGLGSRGDTFDAEWSGPFSLEPEEAMNYIQIEGTAETRIVPDGIRIVLAVTSEGSTAEECQTKIDRQVAAVIEKWTELQTPPDNIVKDFINLLPRYEWRLEERDGQSVGVQKLAGYRMQTNLHVAVKTEQEAMAVITRGFQQGVIDVITFDYWSSQIDEEKQKARSAALKAAQSKADTLLAVFEKRPKIINIQEETKAYLPRSMYRTLENVLEEEFADIGRFRDRLLFRAYRPKMTFLDHVDSQPDISPSEIPMRPEIVVVSGVRLYYKAPTD